MGYHQAGFDVVGIDIEDQPEYPFDFIQGDALMMAGAGMLGFDAIHASPPCPRFSRVSSYHGVRENHPDLIDPTRELLETSGLPWVMENVPGSPLRKDLVLCGEMFGLRVHRHRIFEIGGFTAFTIPHQKHRLKGAKTNSVVELGTARGIYGHYTDHEDAKKAMGIDWMSRGKGMANAIPPSYTEYIGGFLHQAVCMSGTEMAA